MVVGIVLPNFCHFVRVPSFEHFGFGEIFGCHPPQVMSSHLGSVLESIPGHLQIKNIKLHIVTDIKVTFNSMLGFRISLFGWGEGIPSTKENILPQACVTPTPV